MCEELKEIKELIICDNILNTKIECDWCGGEFERSIVRLKNSGYLKHFCCAKCRQEWFAKIYSQGTEWKKTCAIRATKMVTDGIFNKQESSIQTIINNLLEKLKINFGTEYNCKYVAIDNVIYKNDNMLFIENMGSFWHTDPRVYSSINNATQKNRIRLDKSKHTYINNNYNIEILYLWEKDICDNLALCEQLALKYIENDGKLENYHSFNYYIDENNKIRLNKSFIVPYMDWDINDLNEIVDISVKEIMNKKQEDKWTIFNCDYCDKEKEELTSHYIKSDTHCCSQECSGKLQMFGKSIDVKCENCGNPIKIKKSKYDKHVSKKFYCDKNCKEESINITFKCDNCGEETTRLKSEYNRSKNHFCCYDCNTKYKNIC